MSEYEWQFNRAVDDADSKAEEFNIRTFADEVATIDSELGRIADYEGEHDGPTYVAWAAGSKQWRHHCDEAIKLHQRAIEIWQRARYARWKMEGK